MVGVGCARAAQRTGQEAIMHGSRRPDAADLAINVANSSNVFEVEARAVSIAAMLPF